MITQKLDSLGDEFDQLTEGLSPKVSGLIKVLQVYCPKTFPSDMSVEDRLIAAEET